MADFLNITTTGGPELQAYLAQALRSVRQPAELMAALAARLEGNIQERFDTKRDPDGTPWAPLAPATVALYERLDTVRRGRNAGQVRRRGSLLERTRQMRQSLATASGDTYAEVGMSRLSDGGNWSIPLLHETGTTRMPRRGIFFSDPDAGVLGREDEASLDQEITDYLDGAFGGE